MSFDPRTSVGFVVAFEIVRLSLSYLFVGGLSVPSTHLFIYHLSFYCGGMLLSRFASQLVPALLPWRAILGWSIVPLAGLACAESIGLGYLGGDGTPETYVYGGEKISMSLLSVAMILWVILQPSRKGPLQTRLDAIGMRSLAVMLLVDMALTLPTWFFWHIRGPQGVAGPLVDFIPRDYVFITAACFAIGLGGPLIIHGLVSRLGGERARRTLFG